MKAERRHELQHNELADWLAGVIDQTKPHAGVIVAVIGAAILAVVAFAYFSRGGDARRGPAWDAYFQAAEIETFEQRVKDLERVAKDHPGTPAGLWAQITAGDARLLEGTNKSYKDRLAGEEEISKAIDNFKNVEEAAAKLPAAQSEELRLRAMWGLAQAHEALSEPQEAIEQYEQIAKLWPESAFGKTSAVQAKKLSAMEDWFAWYAKVDPKTIPPTRRERQSPIDLQPDPNDIETSLPGPLDLFPPTGTLEDRLGGPAEPSTDETPGETPSEQPPASETPVDDAGNSDAAPATDKPGADEATPEGGN
jgi:hypothetical protein